jgi:hypothetical protein
MLHVTHNKQWNFLSISITHLTCLPPIICYLLLWNVKNFQPPKPYPNKSYIFQSSIKTTIQDPTLNGTHNTPTLHYFKITFIEKYNTDDYLSILWKYSSSLPVITLISGTLSGERSTVRAFRSNASRSILFLVADPHNRYKPTTQIRAVFNKSCYVYKNMWCDKIIPGLGAR